LLNGPGVSRTVPLYPSFEGIKKLIRTITELRRLSVIEPHKKVTDYETRRALLDLAVQWRELAGLMDRMNGEGAPSWATADRLR
jgi:hypothetical protein